MLTFYVNIVMLTCMLFHEEPHGKCWAGNGYKSTVTAVRLQLPWESRGILTAAVKILYRSSYSQLFFTFTVYVCFPPFPPFSLVLYILIWV